MLSYLINMFNNLFIENNELVNYNENNTKNIFNKFKKPDEYKNINSSQFIIK